MVSQENGGVEEMNGGGSISAIIYDKDNDPICFSCRTKLIDLEKDKGRLRLGLHKYHCPHCDDQVCHHCGRHVVYSSSLDIFCCLNKDCPDYIFEKELKR